MKRYKAIYFKGYRSRPSYLIQISKSGRADGVKISFWSDGRKGYQVKYKSNSLNGVDKYWKINSKNWYFKNWKKNKEQGIQIDFEK